MNWLIKICQQEWARQDWVEMLSKTFDLLPHHKGPFTQWTEPNMGRVSFMNETQDIRINFSMDMHLHRTDCHVMIQPKEGDTKSFTMESAPNEFKELPYKLVTRINEILDEPERDFDDGDDDPDPEWEPEPDEGGWVDPPVPEGTPLVPVPVPAPTRPKGREY